MGQDHVLDAHIRSGAQGLASIHVTRLVTPALTDHLQKPSVMLDGIVQRQKGGQRYALQGLTALLDPRRP